MSDAGYNILKGCLIALLYLFLLRVVLLVGRELRGTPAAAVAAPEPVAAHAPATEPVARPSRKRSWQLVVVEPPDRRGESFAVDGEVTIGRGGGCGIVLADDTYVSTVHARAVARDGALWVEDLGSTNGTLVDGTRLDAPREVKRGARVQVGETVLEVRR